MNLDESTSCDSVLGSIALYFDEDTSATDLNDIEDDVLFHIRTSMAGGMYETSKVRRVIYIEPLHANRLGSSAASSLNAYVKPEPLEEERGNASLAAAIVLSVLLAFVGLAFVYSFAKRPQARGVAEEPAHVFVLPTPDHPDETAQPASSIRTTTTVDSHDYCAVEQEVDNTTDTQPVNGQPDHEKLGDLVRLVLSALK